MEESVREYRIGNAIVRIHPGKLTEEERKVVLINAAERFYKDIVNEQRKKNGQESA